MSDALAYALKLPRQKHLTGNLVLNDYSRELAGVLGINATAACVALELFRYGELTYSRDRNNYPRRYHSKLSRLPLVRAAVDGLAARHLITHDRKRPGPHNRGRQSSAKIDHDLAGLILEITGGESIPYPPPLEPVVLRNADGQLSDYRDVRSTNDRRKHLQGHGELIISADIQGCPVSPMERIFNGSFDRGGRAYAPHQTLSKADRARIRINGEPVVELDYRCLHPSILYAERCLMIPSDCYDVDDIDRELVKLALLILICTSSRAEAIGAMSLKLNESDRSKRFKRAGEIIEAVMKRHKPIAGAFHQGEWARLQGIDSDMAETVWWQLARMGIPCLPVHDSFIVPESASGVLLDTMKYASERAVRAPLKVAI